jgi:hypothetical protein
MGCQMCIEVDAEVGPIPCGDKVAYYAHNYGHGPGSDEIAMCGDHAWHAIDDGADVTGPNGYPCRIDEDGDIYEAQP